MKRTKRGDWTTDRLDRPAFGLEAELTLIVDDAAVDPEQMFGDPRGFISAPLMHRIGTSFHLPNGAAVYFDTGVVEIATPAIELERGCASRAARSLWEGIYTVRDHLDRWARENHRRVRLQGFSTHYNVTVGEHVQGPRLPPNALAHALVFVLPAPVMMLATNRRSTGVGVRPRAGRIEVTADFTPDPVLMAATGALVAGVVREMSRWPPAALRRLPADIPVIQAFAPVRHTSRRGWLAHVDCYPASPFACDVDAPSWTTGAGALSLRAIARRVFCRFERSVAALADPLALEAIHAILDDGGATLLALDDRPDTYDDVGREGAWRRDVHPRLDRSQYERVLRNAVHRRPLRLGADTYTPVGVRGWSRIVFRRDRDGVRIVLPFDVLVDRLSAW